MNLTAGPKFTRITDNRQMLDMQGSPNAMGPLLAEIKPRYRKSFLAKTPHVPKVTYTGGAFDNGITVLCRRQFWRGFWERWCSPIANEYPIIVAIYFLYYGTVSRSVGSFIFGLSVLFEGLLNFVFKQVAQRVWNQFPQLTKIVGQGDRPTNADECCGNLPGVRLSALSGAYRYGMPSGHAQIAFSISLFWILILTSQGNLNFIRGLSQTTIAIAIAWSRVSNKCHTVAQVVIGALIGSLIGLVKYLLLSRFRI